MSELSDAQAERDYYRREHNALVRRVPTKVTLGPQAMASHMGAGMAGALAGALEEWVPSIPSELPNAVIGTALEVAGGMMKDPNLGQALSSFGSGFTLPVMYNLSRGGVRYAITRMNKYMNGAANSATPKAA